MAERGGSGRSPAAGGGATGSRRHRRWHGFVVRRRPARAVGRRQRSVPAGQLRDASDTNSSSPPGRRTAIEPRHRVNGDEVLLALSVEEDVQRFSYSTRERVELPDQRQWGPSSNAALYCARLKATTECVDGDHWVRHIAQNLLTASRERRHARIGPRRGPVRPSREQPADPSSACAFRRSRERHAHHLRAPRPLGPAWIDPNSRDDCTARPGHTPRHWASTRFPLQASPRPIGTRHRASGPPAAPSRAPKPTCTISNSRERPGGGAAGAIDLVVRRGAAQPRQDDGDGSHRARTVSRGQGERLDRRHLDVAELREVLEPRGREGARRKRELRQSTAVYPHVSANASELTC